jgi:hypothetical protein
MKEGSRSRRRIPKIAVAVAAVLFGSQLALAQGLKPASTTPKTHPIAHPVQRKPAAAADAGTPPPNAAGTALSSAPQAFGAGVPGDAGVVESRTLDGGTRVFKFSELDIEGRLKSPQLVYFLRRVRAEFGAGDLGHRSFLREMSETRKEPTF